MTATTTATARPKQTKGRGPVQLSAARTPSDTAGLAGATDQTPPNERQNRATGRKRP